MYNLVVIPAWDIFYSGYNFWKLNKRKEQAEKTKPGAFSWVGRRYKKLLYESIFFPKDFIVGHSIPGQ